MSATEINTRLTGSGGGASDVIISSLMRSQLREVAMFSYLVCGELSERWMWVWGCGLLKLHHERVGCRACSCEPPPSEPRHRGDVQAAVIR